MLWLLVLHIGALLFWCAALLYLPALIAGALSGRVEITESHLRKDSVVRFVFTHIATPAALLAIISGTAVFLINTTVAPWLIAKLTLVSGLVVGHAVTGLFILRLEDEQRALAPIWCWLLASVLCLLMLAIVWLVLAKPTLTVEALPWAW